MHMGNYKMYTAYIPIVAVLIAASLVVNVAATQPTPTPIRLLSGSSMKAAPFVNAGAVLDNQRVKYSGTTILGGKNRTTIFYLHTNIYSTKDWNFGVYDFEIPGIKYRCEDYRFYLEPYEIVLENGPLALENGPQCLETCINAAAGVYGHNVFNITLHQYYNGSYAKSYITFTVYDPWEGGISYIVMNYKSLGPAPTPPAPTPPAPTPTIFPSSDSTGLSVGLIIGISAGGLFALAIVAGLGFWWRKRNEAAAANSHRKNLLPESDCDAFITCAAPVPSATSEKW